MRVLALAALLVLAASLAPAADVGWPVQIDAQGGWTVTLYQPQIDSLLHDKLHCRAAVSVVGPGVEDPVFGAVWIIARLDVDRVKRVVRIASVQVPEVRFAEASEEGRRKLAALLEREIPSWNIEVSLDRFVAALEAVENADSVQGLKNDPPRIVLSTEPALLVTIDGEPKLAVIPGQVGQEYPVEYVVNTPCAVMYDPRSQYYYLAGGGGMWFRALQVEGPWEATQALPATVKFLAPKEKPPKGTLGGGIAAAPKVIVATEPTEVIATTGEPEWAPVEGTGLELLGNSDTPLLRDKATGSCYVVLSGRWYRGRSLSGPWEYVAADRLPPGFREIPADSPAGSVRVHVAGTPEAREATLDAVIPETSAVRRDATISVVYDGKPQFEGVEGTDLEYAVNTASQVIKVDGSYYCCEQGVWYQAKGPTGPWRVCTEVPDAIYRIPPSNPNYNVTYVRVYDSTPDVVFVGYTPGYLGSYVANGCTVYGTGWHYPGWYGSVYFPGQSTWGFHSAYDPWTGAWGFGVGRQVGPVTITIGVSGWGWSPGLGSGWFGVGGYFPQPGGLPYPGYPGPGWDSPPGAPYFGGAPVDLYQRTFNAERVAPGYGAQPSAQPRYVGDRANNVYTDTAGNVYRRGSNGAWEQRSSGGWHPAASYPRSLPGDYRARQRGAERIEQYQSHRR